MNPALLTKAIDGGELTRSRVVADITDRAASFTELELLATGRAIPIVRDGRTIVLPIGKGGAVGGGDVYAKNLPAPGTFEIDPVNFAARTQAGEKTYPSIAWPGYSSKIEQRIDKHGVIAKMWIVFDGTVTPGASTPTVKATYPWNLINRVKVSANGVANLWYADGTDLRALQRVRREFFLDRESTFALPTGGGAAVTLRAAWEVPIAYDESLIGAVFAQTEDTELIVSIETPASADLWATNAPTVAGNFYVVVQFFSIPVRDSQDGRKLLLPDIRQLHGVVTSDTPITGTAMDHVTPLQRTGGVLLRTMQRGDNAYPNLGALDLSTYVTAHRFRYGSNVVPRDKPGWIARWLNNVDYGDKTLPAADYVSATTPPLYIVDDFVKASSIRDVIYLLGISEPQLLNYIASTATINSGANMHTLQEHMVAG